MKPKLLAVNTPATNSFSVRQDMIPNINNQWHYHTEVELIQFHKGRGTQFVGDHIKPFKAGDIVLVGSNLPHYWKYDDKFFEAKDEWKPFATVIHFNENFWGEKFLNLPELKGIKNVLDNAKRGIMIPGEKAAPLTKMIRNIQQKNGLERMIGLVQTIAAIGRFSHSIQLSSLGFQLNVAAQQTDRINEIYQHSLARFKKKITLHEIANIAGLSTNSFCRYFKTKTGKNYIRFLTEIRVGYACKLIIDNRLSIKQICFESGFNNSVCFHKNFKQITGKTPQAYLNEHKG